MESFFPVLKKLIFKYRCISVCIYALIMYKYKLYIDLLDVCMSYNIDVLRDVFFSIIVLQNAHNTYLFPILDYVFIVCVKFDVSFTFNPYVNIFISSLS